MKSYRVRKVQTQEVTVQAEDEESARRMGRDLMDSWRTQARVEFEVREQ